MQGCFVYCSVNIFRIYVDFVHSNLFVIAKSWRQNDDDIVCYYKQCSCIRNIGLRKNVYPKRCHTNCKRRRRLLLDKTRFVNSNNDAFLDYVRLATTLVTTGLLQTIPNLSFSINVPVKFHQCALADIFKFKQHFFLSRRFNKFLY